MSRTRVSLEEKKWLRFFEDPSRWWDNRAKKWNSYPDFKDVFTGESLWTNSAPEWVHAKLETLESSAHGLESKRAKYKPSFTTKGDILPEDVQAETTAEQKWLQFFEDPSMWWDNRGNKWKNSPDFKHVTSVDSLWIDSRNCPGWVHDRLSTLDGPYSKSGERAKYQSGSDVKVNVWCLLSALKSCAVSRDLERGRAVHQDVIIGGLRSNVYVATALVDMYSKCGSMAEARTVFTGMPEHDTVSWNALLLGYAEKGDGGKVFELFENMKTQGCEPDARTFVAVLRACADMAKEGSNKPCLEKGLAVHAELKDKGFESDIYIGNTLIDMFSKCSTMSRARKVFDNMTHRDAVSWNAILKGYVENGESLTALQMFQLPACTPNARTFVIALQACINLAENGQENPEQVKLNWLENGRSIHAKTTESGCDLDKFVANALVKMYAKCGSMPDAREVFDGMRNRELVSWNTLLFGYIANSEYRLALRTFELMKSQGGCRPDGRSYVGALMACSALEDKPEALKIGTELHSQASKSGYESEIFVRNTLVSMYAKCGSLVEARRAFDSILHRNAVSWTSMMLGYVESGEPEMALDLFSRMDCKPDAQTFVAALKACSISAAEEESKQVGARLVKEKSLGRVRAVHSRISKSDCRNLDIFVWNSLVDAFGKCGSLEDAEKVFFGMVSRSLVSWNALMQAYAGNGESPSAMELYGEVKKVFYPPDARSLAIVLKACGSLGSLELGRSICAEVYRHGHENDPFVAVTLIQFYSSCACMEIARCIFDSADSPDVVLWDALIAGYSHQVDTTQVFNLFHRMATEGVKPGAVSFVCVLSACSHAGLVEQGKSYLGLMSNSRYGLSPEIKHYTCMVSLLSRVNRMEEAVSLIDNMPFKPNAAIWLALLSGCRKWKNVGVGKMAFESLLRVDSGRSLGYSLMENIYASRGMWEEKEKVLEMVQRAGICSKLGRSWWFDEPEEPTASLRQTAADRIHVQTGEMYSKIE